MIEYIWTSQEQWKPKEYIAYIDWERRVITSILSDNDKTFIDTVDDMKHIKKLVSNLLLWNQTHTTN